MSRRQLRLSSRCRPSRRHRRAFTLIELLVSMIIIAVISAVALLSLGILGDDRNLQTEVRRLTSLIEMANDEAAVLGREYGLELSAYGYRFVEFDPLLNRWYEVIGDDLMRARRLADGLEFDLFIEDRRVTLAPELATLLPPEPEVEADDEDDDADSVNRNDSRDDDRDRRNDYQPHIMIMSSGDLSPFELRILRPDDRAEVTLVASLTGELKIKDDADDRR